MPKKEKNTLKKIKKIGSCTANALELPKEIIHNLPLISIMGNEEMRIENFKNIIEISDEKIRVNTKCGILVISGSHLYIREICSSYIVLSGVIAALEIHH